MLSNKPKTKTFGLWKNFACPGREPGVKFFKISNDHNFWLCDRISLIFLQNNQWVPLVNLSINLANLNIKYFSPIYRKWTGSRTKKISSPKNLFFDFTHNNFRVHNPRTNLEGSLPSPRVKAPWFGWTPIGNISGLVIKIFHPKFYLCCRKRGISSVWVQK